MKKRKVIAVISISIVLVIVAFVLIAVYTSDETTDLKPGPVDFNDASIFNEYTVRFYDGDDVNKLASVYFRISEEHDGLNEITLQIWHEEDTHLDELKLAFPNIIGNRLMFILPTGSWPPMEFGRTEDGQGWVIDIPDFGFVGEGSVLMNLSIQSYNLEELYCYIDMQLSKDKGLKTIEYNAETNMEINVPGGI